METNGFNVKLLLNEPRAIYYAGQLLTGHAEFELTQPINFSAINALFLGEAKVFWIENEVEEYNGIRRAVTVKYLGKETYFNVPQNISGPVTLPPGKHCIPFQYNIPFATPSSFSGPQGSVVYKVIVYSEYPDPTVERNQWEKAFEVVAPLDLNKGPDYKDPIDLDFEEVYTCCCSSSPMNISIHIPASGFCPGQAIPITVNANNGTNFEIKKISFKLVQKECYHAKEPPSQLIPPEEVLAEVKTGPVLSKRRRELKCDLIVPDLIVPNLENCSIIDVTYVIKMTVKLSGCNDDLEDETEIVLGLVPLQALLGDRTYTHPMKSDLPLAPIPEPPSFITPSFTTGSSYPNTAPPYTSPAPVYSPGNSLPNGGNSYPNAGAAYPISVAPYPTSVAPYPTSVAPYPTSVAPYPTAGAPYPTKDTPNPNSPYNSNFHAKNEMPMTTMPSQTGFVVPPPSSPYPSNPLAPLLPTNPPYPTNPPSYAPSPASAPPQ